MGTNMNASIGTPAGSSLNSSIDRPVFDKPNFILINVDNLGYGDLGCYGSTDHYTPRLDAFAREGIRCTDFYVTSGVCTPSRASLMTGCYAQRLGMHDDGNGGCVLFPIASRGLAPSELTIADLLGSTGYATCCIGKWHLGDQVEYLPTNHGFDRYYGIPYSEDMKHTVKKGWPPLPLLRDETVVEAPANLETITERYTEETVSYIREHADRPFFLYLAHATPGSERTAQVSKRFGGTSRNGAYGDSVHELDWSTGQILDALDQYGMADHTVVVFMSDNGAVHKHGGSNAPLSGWGYSTDEGGMRVPCIVRWPGVTTAGQTCDSLVTAMDFLPTFASAAGVTGLDGHKVDGHDITNVLANPDTVDSPYEVFFYYQMEQLQAVRSGTWKLRLELENKIDHGRRDQGQVREALFDVSTIPDETNIDEATDALREHPEIVKKLRDYAEHARATLGDTDRPGTEQRDPGFTQDPTPRLLEVE